MKRTETLISGPKYIRNTIFWILSVDIRSVALNGLA